MLTSLAYILLLGLLLGALAGKLRLPPLIGMIAAGILLGPSCLNLLSDSLLNISADLRQLALIIILTRAGLTLDVAALKRVGRPAVLMCFLPACFEIAGMVLLAPRLLGVSVLDAAIIGAVLATFFKKFHMRDSVKVVILLSLAFLLVAAEDALEGLFPFSGLLAVMGMGVGLQRFRGEVAVRLSAKFSKLWVAAEVALFVLVGAAVDLKYAAAAGAAAVLAVLGALCFRALGVVLCVAGSGFSRKEKLFCVLGYLPKATVQAAIGGVPLAMGLGCGQIVLTVAVVAILVTAPLGALAIDASYKKLLTKAK